MPGSANQESGLLFRKTMCYSDIPIKKRPFRFPFPPDEPESVANGLSVVDDSSKDCIGKFDVVDDSVKNVRKESVGDIDGCFVRPDVCREPRELRDLGGFRPVVLDVKKEVPLVGRADLVKGNAEFGKPWDEGISTAVVSDSVGKVNNSDSLVSELYAEYDVSKISLRFPIVNVKREMVESRSEEDYKRELSTAVGNTKSCFTSNELVDSSLEKVKVDLSTEVSPPLSLSLSKPDVPINMGTNNTVSDSNVIMSSTDRSNWDLNTTMDAWVRSVEEAASHDITVADELSSSHDTHETKHFDEGKGVMEQFEGKSAPCIPSLSPRQFSVADSILSSLRNTSSSQDSSLVIPHLMSQRPIINSISPDSRKVKSEPVDDNLKPDPSLVPGGTTESLDNRLANKNSAESYDKSLIGNFGKIVELTSIKSEVSHDSNQESHCAASYALKRPSSNMVQLQESCSSSSTVVSGPVTPQHYCVSKLTTFSELPGRVGVLDQSEDYSNITELKLKGITNPSVTREISKPVDNYYEDSDVCDDFKVNSSEAMTSSFQRSDENNIEPNTIAEESASDKEKISAMVEDGPYGPDYESDGNQAVSQMGRDDGQCEKVDDDYEDGEVREFPVMGWVRDPTCDRVFLENSEEVDDGCEMGAPTNQSTINEKLCDFKLREESNDHNKGIETMTNGKGNPLVSDYDSSLITKSEKITSAQTESKAPEKLLGDLCVKETVHGVKENDLMGYGNARMNDMVKTTISVARNENQKGCDANGGPDSSMTKEEVNVNERGSFKDSTVGGNRSRIINLPRASNSPSKFRPLSGRSFTSYGERERYGDVDGNDIYYPRHRDDTHGEDFKKFSRNRSFRGSRKDFKNDRGRGTSRFDSEQNNWDPEQDFLPKSYDVSADYRVNRHRRASAVTDNGLRCNDFDIAQGRTGPSAGRIGRKPSIDEFRLSHQPSSRRLSPGSRDGATIKSLPNSRRLPESGSDMPKVGHEKYSRGLPDNIGGSVYTRAHSTYDEIGGQFVNESQDYSTDQRRFFRRARSKSPGSTQQCSPGTWPSSRRRFNDDFNNPSDHIQHKSHMYREERMRSPDRECYTDELGDRRRVAPNHVIHRPNEMLDMDFSQEQGNLRSVSSSRRSPSDLVFPRSTRRLDVLDSRERTGSDEYFSGTINSGRFREFRSDGGNDERRKFGEKRGQFRPSRPSYGGGNENYPLNAEDGPLKFCSDQDTESFERSNIRQRGFDVGGKTHPFIAQRQIRSTEDQEGSFEQSGQVWHDDSFSDGSRMKKRRF